MHFGRCNGAPDLDIFILIPHSILVGSTRKTQMEERIEPAWISCFPIPFVWAAYCRTEVGGFFSTNARAFRGAH